MLTVAVVNLAIGRKTFVPSLLGKTATAVYIVTCVTVLTANYAGGGEALVSTAVLLSGSHHGRFPRCTTSGTPRASSTPDASPRPFLTLHRPRCRPSDAP